MSNFDSAVGSWERKPYLTVRMEPPPQFAIYNPAIFVKIESSGLRTITIESLPKRRLHLGVFVIGRGA